VSVERKAKPKVNEAAEAITTLQKARALIENPESWIKRAFFKRPLVKSGPNKGRENYHAKPIGFCALGALRTADGPGEQKATETLAQAITELYYKTKPQSRDQRIYSFNDNKAKHETMLAAFDRALAIAQAEADAEAAANE
jgi:hypothetical protein